MTRTATRATLLAALLLATAPGTAQAHRMWLEPSTFTLSGTDQWITVDGAISNDLFVPNHVALPLNSLSVTGPDGAPVALENAHRGKLRSVFDLKLEKDGTYRIAEEGAAFIAMWKEDGEQKRRRGTLEELRKAGLESKPEAKFVQSMRRVETFVTLGAPNDTALKPKGQGLELLPVTHPNDIVAGEKATLKLLLNGAPAAGLKVTIVKAGDQYRDKPATQEVETGADGAFAFTVAEPGRYWLNAQSRGRTTVEGLEMDRMLSYVATVEAAAP